MQQAAAYYCVTFTYSHFNGPGRGGATIDTDLLVTFRRNREKKTSLGGFLSKANQARPFIPMKYFFVCVCCSCASCWCEEIVCVPPLPLTKKKKPRKTCSLTDDCLPWRFRVSFFSLLFDNHRFCVCVCVLFSSLFGWRLVLPFIDNSNSLGGSTHCSMLTKYPIAIVAQRFEGEIHQ